MIDNDNKDIEVIEKFAALIGTFWFKKPDDAYWKRIKSSLEKEKQIRISKEMSFLFRIG